MALLVGFAALFPVFMGRAVSSRPGLAVAVGGILLAYQALTKGLSGYASLTTAAIAWQRIGPLFKQGRTQASSLPMVKLADDVNNSDDVECHSDDANAAGNRVRLPVVQLSNISFKYPGRQQSVLNQCDLTIYPGERLLLQGHSGCGKSTLANILIGVNQPQQGLMLYKGLDLPSVGSQVWRKKIVSAPQFHENHVLSETFAFNLLMGGQWPPTAEVLAEAETICDELGLSDLLQRMPGGIMQMVGETGWQLSHGEKSRLYIARALLQGAELIILDESFAALDPENLSRALDCVIKRARTLLVIAHP